MIIYFAHTIRILCTELESVKEGHTTRFKKLIQPMDIKKSFLL